MRQRERHPAKDLSSVRRFAALPILHHVRNSHLTSLILLTCKLLVSKVLTVSYLAYSLFLLLSRVRARAPPTLREIISSCERNSGIRDAQRIESRGENLDRFLVSTFRIRPSLPSKSLATFLRCCCSLFSPFKGGEDAKRGCPSTKSNPAATARFSPQKKNGRG